MRKGLDLRPRKFPPPRSKPGHKARMKSRNRLVFTVCLALLSSTWLSRPSLAQKSETAALSAKINELSRAGKYAEAMVLAQGQVESLEKKYGAAHRDVTRWPKISALRLPTFISARQRLSGVLGAVCADRGRGAH